MRNFINGNIGKFVCTIAFALIGAHIADLAVSRYEDNEIIDRNFEKTDKRLSALEKMHEESDEEDG